MKERIFSVLESIAPTFYRTAPEDYVELPVIIYYYLTNQPLYLADNTFSKERRIVFNVDVFHSSDVDDLALQITEALRNEGAILRNERDISEEDVFGTSLEFEIHDFLTSF